MFHNLELRLETLGCGVSNRIPSVRTPVPVVRSVDPPEMKDAFRLAVLDVVKRSRGSEHDPQVLLWKPWLLSVPMHFVRVEPQHKTSLVFSQLVQKREDPCSSASEANDVKDQVWSDLASHSLCWEVLLSALPWSRMIAHYF